MKPYKLGIALLAIVISAASSVAQDKPRPAEPSNVAQAQVGKTTFVGAPTKAFDDLKRKRLAEITLITKLQQDKQAYEQSRSAASDQQQQLDARINDLKPPQSLVEIDENIGRVNKEKDRLQADLTAAKAATPSDAKTVDELTKSVTQMARYGDELEYQKKFVGRVTDEYNNTKQKLEQQLTTVSNNISSVDNKIIDIQDDLQNHTQKLQNIEEKFTYGS
jgi:chromosome segregation ATPase